MQEKSKRIERIFQKKQAKLRSDMITKFGINKVDIIDSVIKSDPQAIESDISYQHLCDRFAHRVSNYQPMIPLTESRHKSPQMPQSTANKEQIVPHHNEPQEEKRKLPVNPKDQVFDEWGAVIKQHDEYAQKLKEKEQQNYKIAQSNYREELENQIRHRRQIQESYTQSLHMTEKDDADKVQKAIEDNRKAIENMAEEKKRKAIGLIKEMEMQSKILESNKKEEKNRDKMEFDKILANEAQEQREIAFQTKQSNQKKKEDIITQNQMLLQVKQQQKQLELEKDKMYNKMQIESSEKSEMERMKV